MDNIYCPLLDREIKGGECFDIHMVVEDDAPSWTAPEGATLNPDFKRICRNCKNHRED